MGAITPTRVVTISSPGGEYVTKIFTVTPGSASDTVDLTSHFDSVLAIVGAHINSGADSALQTAHVTNSNETLTVVTKGGDGNAATDWTGASITLTVVGTAYPQ